MKNLRSECSALLEHPQMASGESVPICAAILRAHRHLTFAQPMCRFGSCNACFFLARMLPLSQSIALCQGPRGKLNSEANTGLPRLPDGDSQPQAPLTKGLVCDDYG